MGMTVTRTTSLRFALVFLFVFSALQAIMLKCEGTLFERFVIDEATVGVAAAVIDQAFPHDEVNAAGATIQSKRVHLNVLRGCEGTEAMFLLIAAVIAYPSTWKQRFTAIVIGCLVAYCINQLRILLLYFTVRDARHYFELMHGYIAPTFMIVAIVVYFMLWVARQQHAAPVRSS